jgi:hypothetical protein
MSKISKCSTLIVSLLVACPMTALSLRAQNQKAAKANLPSAEQLAAITARGKMLEAYDIASWHASDVIHDLKPTQGSTRYYIAKKEDSGWVVVFGRLSDAKDKFLIVYEATQGTKPEFFTAKKYDPPMETADFYFFAARSLEAALKDLGPVNRPYNAYALPSEAGQLYIYLLPAQTKDTIYPLGGDVRYTFTADGSALIEKHQMHKAILDIDYGPSDKGGKTVSGMHTHVLSNVPEDSDVFHVLTRKPSIPEFIGTMDKKIWVIHTDGSIGLGKQQ